MAKSAYKAGGVITLECVVCGSEFSFTKSGPGARPKACSAACKEIRQQAQRRTRRLPVRHQHQCARCGEAFSSKRPEARFCSRKCQRVGKSYSGASKLEQRPCRHCGVAFSVRKDNDRCFCSAKCREAESRLKAALKHGTVVAVVTYHRSCDGCGRRFHTKQSIQRYCDADCRVDADYKRRKPPLQPKACCCCGIAFMPSHGAEIYCSQVCRLKGTKAKLRASGSKAAWRKRRKAQQRGVTVETVNPFTVLERDGWRCQLCGVATPKRLRGTYDERAPEVDHIIPLALGGEHSYRNCQCACRKCNLEKGGTARGQTRLFG